MYNAHKKYNKFKNNTYFFEGKITLIVVYFFLQVYILF